MDLYPFPLLTARLILRPFTSGDINAFARYRSDPEVARFQSWEAPFPLEKAARFVDEMKTAQPGWPGEWFQLAVELKATGALIGDVGFVVLDEPAAPERQGEIGFTMARAFQGYGYASEAVARVLDYLFDHLNLRRVRANCDPANTASARLLRRVGMRQEGHFVESLWLKGEWVSEDWYAILKRERIHRPPGT